LEKRHWNAKRHRQRLSPVLILLEDSLSESLLAVAIESISSINTIDGLFSRAVSNIILTSFSLSPSHLEVRSDEDMLRKVASASVATAFARYDFPVPGGP
jgi:hypothetical protein